MVVILIIAILLWLGNFWGLFSRRENARIEELAVNLVGLIDGEKTSALLGKTEWGAIVRKRKVAISFDNNTGTTTYNAYADLAEDAEDSYCSTPTKCPDSDITNKNTPLTTKSWTLVNLWINLFQCTDWTPSSVRVEGQLSSLSTVLLGDTMSITTSPESTKPHIVLQITRNDVYREIHIDRRTGLTYERAGLTSTPSCI